MKLLPILFLSETNARKYKWKKKPQVTSNAIQPRLGTPKKPFIDRMVWSPRQIAWLKAHDIDTSSFYTTGREEWRGIPDVDKPNSYIEKWPADEDGKITISWTYLDKVKAGSSGYSTSEGKKLKEWMSELTGDIGCINFEYKDISTLKRSDEGYGIVIANDKSVMCQSFLGFEDGYGDGTYYNDLSFLSNVPDDRVPQKWQPVTVTDACDFSMHTLTHEILHAIGIEHEQSRGDRPEFIEVVDDKYLQNGMPSNFAVMSLWQDQGIPYELESVMQYSYNSGLKTSGPNQSDWAMRVLDKWRPQSDSRWISTNGYFRYNGDFIGRATTTDIMQIQKFYCPNYSPKAKKTCPSNDALGFTREVFSHRLCDGIPDCSNGEDETVSDWSNCDAGSLTEKGCCEKIFYHDLGRKHEFSLSGKKNGFDRYVGRFNNVDVQLFRDSNNQWSLTDLNNEFGVWSKQTDSGKFNCPSETSIYGWDGDGYGRKTTLSCRVYPKPVDPEETKPVVESTTPAQTTPKPTTPKPTTTPKETTPKLTTAKPTTAKPTEKTTVAETKPFTTTASPDYSGDYSGDFSGDYEWECNAGSSRNFGELYANKPCEVPDFMCPQKGKFTWTKKVAKVMYKSNISTMIKINIPVSTNSFVKDSEYIGFIQFPKKFCGMPFVKALSSFNEEDPNDPYYESFVEIFDYENVYHYQYRHFRNDGIHSSGVIQFYRRLSDKDLGNHKRDSMFLVISGLNDFDFGTKSLEECINGIYVSAMQIDESISGGLEANFAGCAAYDKDLGYKGKE